VNGDGDIPLKVGQAPAERPTREHIVVDNHGVDLG
jgi:hypothetical protein